MANYAVFKTFDYYFLLCACERVVCVVFICLYVPLVSDLRSAMEYGRKGREEWWREKKIKKRMNKREREGEKES